METILKEGVNKVSSVSADDFIDAMILIATPGKAAASHANVTLRPSVTAGKYDIEIAPPAGAPAGTAPQTYAEGLSLADARAIIAEGSVHASPSPAFLTQLRGPLAPHQVTFGNLKVTVENPAAAVADRTYLVECDGVVFSRGKKLAETDQYIADAAAIRDLDTALDTLSPTAIPPGAPAGTPAVPGARVAQVNGYWVHRQPHGEYTIGTQRFANRDALIAELAARDRASRTLFAQDSSLMRNYVDRIVDKLAKKSKVELDFAGNKVTIERLGANKFSVSDSTGTPAIVVDSFTSTQSQLRAAIVKKAGIEANGLRYLDENSPVVLQKALESLKGKSLAQAAGDTYKAGMAKIKNTKAKTLLEGLFRKESIPLYEGLFVNLPHNFARGKIFGTLGWVLTGGAKNTGFMSTMGNIAFVQGGAWGTTKLANGLESWAQGEGFMTGLKNDNYDNLGEWLLSTAAFGASSAWGKAFATIILNVDFDNFVGDTEEDLLTYIGKEIQKS